MATAARIEFKCVTVAFRQDRHVRAAVAVKVRMDAGVMTPVQVMATAAQIEFKCVVDNIGRF